MRLCSQIMAIILSISNIVQIIDCSILQLSTNNLISNNNSISLISLSFSYNNLGGIGADGLVYLCNSQNNATNMYDMKSVNILNNSNLAVKNMKIWQNSSRSICRIMIVNNNTIQIYNSNYIRQNTIQSHNSSYTFISAIFGMDDTQIFTFQTYCYQFNYNGTNNYNFTTKLSQYLNNILARQYTSTYNQCQTNNWFDKMVYSDNNLYLMYTHKIQIYNVTSLVKIYDNTIFTTQILSNYTDISVNQKYISYSINNTLYILRVSNFSQKCAYEHSDLIISVKSYFAFTFFITLKYMYQFDNDLCKIIHQSKLPTYDTQYQLQFNNKTNQIILYQQQGFTNSYVYSYLVNNQTQTNTILCYQTYRYIGNGICRKNQMTITNTIPIRLSISSLIQSMPPRNEEFETWEIFKFQQGLKLLFLAQILFICMALKSVLYSIYIDYRRIVLRNVQKQ